MSMGPSSVSQATSSVGVVSVCVTAYCLVLFLSQYFIKHEARKVVIGFSYCSLLLMALSSTFSALTYYAPRLGSDDTCYCYPLWSGALIAYVASIYTIKAMYVIRIYIISQGSMLGTEQTNSGIKFVSVTLAICCILCIVLMAVMTDGECHANQEHTGCLTKFHVVDIYVAIFMLVFDAVLFSMFCYKWYHIMRIFQMSDPNNRVPAEIMQSFVIQFTLTLIAMASCFFDGIVHLLLHNDGKNYDITMIIFLFDCTVVATCNFCMISESQRMIATLCCFCCNKLSLHWTRAPASSVSTVQASTPSGISMAKIDFELPAQRRPNTQNNSTSSFENMTADTPRSETANTNEMTFKQET